MRLNEKTFTQLYDDNFEIVCRFLNNYTRDRETIREVVQDLFVRLWEDRDTIEIAYIKTYLYNGARNRILNHLRNEANRNHHTQKWANDEAEQRGSADCVDWDWFYLVLQSAIDSLPPKCKDIFVMKKEEELSYKEIASRKNISVKTVEGQMGLALKRIREYVRTNYPQSVIIASLMFFSSVY